MKSLTSSSAVAAIILSLAASSAFAAPSAKDFINDAVQGDNAEMMLGRLAQQKASNAQVRDFGQMMATDHAKARDEALSVAKTNNITPSEQPSSDAEAEKGKLSSLSGADFDNEFMRFMVADHQKVVHEFQDEADANQGPTSDLAAKQLPVLQKHLSMAQAVSKNIAQKVTGAAGVGDATNESADQWRASKLVGVMIYDSNNQKVGSIADVLMNKEGKAEFVIVGVGGFLGIGEKDVSIRYVDVKFSDKPMVSPTQQEPAAKDNAMGATVTTTDPAMAPATARTTAYPDHGNIALTIDQIKSAPSFHFAS